MCGIVGYVGPKKATPILVNGLRRLEYRGYDSAGIAVINGEGLELRRSPGKLSALEDLLQKKPTTGTVGLGHTRWATHGRPSEENAHPHTCCNNEIVVVHNGIIENYVELKTDLIKKGHRFRSQTDTEVLAHVIESFYQGDLLAAVRRSLETVQGSYAIGVLTSKEPGRVVAARKDSPLVVGIGKDEMFLASDVPAVLPYTRQVIFLEDGDVADLTASGVNVCDVTGKAIQRTVQTITWDPIQAEKAGYKHFMLKEIFEQPLTVRDTFRGRISLEENKVLLDDVLPVGKLQNIQKICLVGCGTSYHAGLVARFWFEELASIGCEVEIASELRYRRFTKEPNVLFVAVTQSGETADTLAALRDCKAKGLTTLAICNVVGSTMTRDADHTLYTHCGPEIGVASTKAFTGQLTALFLLALYIGQTRGSLEGETLKKLLTELSHIPALLRQAANQDAAVKKAAKTFFKKTNFLYLGRHVNYPIALEGALKLKEISYIHAEGYPAGEMKHGPIALIDDNLPVVAIAPHSSVYDKMLSNMEEVRARGGIVISVGNPEDSRLVEKSDTVLPIPDCSEVLTPILTIIPLQLLAYHVAVLRGCDVDQPRNLAKSVTVE